MSWHIAAASVTGTSHLRANRPCQDSHAFAIVGEFCIGIVADGAGSAARSEIGSRLAADTTLACVKEHPWSVIPPTLEEAAQVAEQTHEAVLSVLRERAVVENCALEDFATTLVAFVAAPQWLMAIQTGDGLLVARPEHGEYELILRPDKGEYFNETTFVTSPQAREQRGICVRHGHFPFICAASDGIECVSMRYDWMPHGPFFKPLEESMNDAGTTNDDVAEFLQRPKLNARTDDDKTLILCSYSA